MVSATKTQVGQKDPDMRLLHVACKRRPSKFLGHILCYNAHIINKTCFQIALHTYNAKYEY
jgi:hypothetical protein